MLNQTFCRNKAILASNNRSYNNRHDPGNPENIQLSYLHKERDKSAREVGPHKHAHDGISAGAEHVGYL